MSEIFDGYERQYCELSANLSRKCTSVPALHGGENFSSGVQFGWLEGEGVWVVGLMFHPLATVLCMLGESAFLMRGLLLWL